MSRPQGSAGEPRVLLYTRVSCHLCEEARAVVADVCGAAGETWREVDIDVDGPGGDLVGKYGDYVPVVEVDGVQQGFWRVDGARLARRLAR
ncbi:glutaredoxin family protein [Isoptericola sp. NPDC056573]|uniref:glutaredoxin family protein n=1 Tax=Isoptericola sp. NPDC056573 TaxID=3345868 RepID=UPI00368DCFD6